MSTQIIKGDELQLFIGDSAPRYATAHSLTLTGSTIDSNTKDHGFWGASEVGKITWELTAECLYTDVDYDEMFNMLISRNKFMLKFARVKNYDVNGLVDVGGNVQAWEPELHGLQGYASITSITANANTGENATYSITFTGAGSLSKYELITDYIIQVKYKNEEIAEGMQLFNTLASSSIKSAWVCQEWNFNDKVQINISDGTLHDSTPAEAPVFLYYLSRNAVPENIFNNVNTISEVFLPNNITKIESNAFSNSSIVNVRLNGQTIIYDENAFSNCSSLTYVNATESTSYLCAETIGKNAFKECVKFGNINVGDECSSIGLNAFIDCMAMNEIHIGQAVTNVENYAFASTTMETPKNIHFYTATAPNCSSLSYGNAGFPTFILHNASSVDEFLAGTNMAVHYPQGTFSYTIAS